MNRSGTVAALALFLAVMVGTAGVVSAAHVAVYDLHTTPSDFQSGSLSNVTVDGSGEAASLNFTSASTGGEFFDGFEGQSAGTPPDGWERVEDAEGAGQTDNGVVEITANESYEGTNAVHFEESQGGNVLYIRPDQQPRTDTTADVTAALKANSVGATTTIRLFSGTGDEPEIAVGMRNGDLQYYDGTWHTLDNRADPGEWVRVTVHDIDTSADTYSIEWEIGGGLGGGQNDVSMNGGLPAGGWDNSIIQANNEAWADNFAVGDYDEGSTKGGTYTSANYTVVDVQDGWTNLTLSNAQATVTWQGSNGATWTDVASSTYTTSGNRTIALSGSYDTWRVQVEVGSTSSGAEAELHDEGIRFSARETAVDNSSLTPNETTVNAPNPMLEVNITDGDFGQPQGDSVDVEFFVQEPGGSYASVGTDTLTSNGTASLTPALSSGGEHDWYAVANDSYGHSQQTNTANFTIAATVGIKNESAPNEYIKSPVTVNVKIFSGDESTVLERTITDGNVTLTGVPLGESVIIRFEADGWYTRTLYVPDPFEQDSVYLLNKSVVPNAKAVTFTLDDPSAAYGPQSILYVERALNISGDTTWTTILGDEFGAAGVRTNLAPDNRYRLRITNGEQTAQMGSYVPPNATTGEIVTLRPDAPAVELTNETTVAVNASIDDAGTLHVGYVDPAERTETMTITVVNRQNSSDVLFGPQTYTDQQSITISEPVGTTNETYLVRFNGTRDGEPFNATAYIGPEQRDIVPGGLSGVWVQVAGIGLLLIVGGLFSQFNVSVGVLITSLFAGVLWYIGLLQGVASWASVALAITFSVLYGLVANR